MFILKFISFFNIFYSYIIREINIKKILSYYKFCKNYNYKKIKQYKNIKLNPKISVISPLLNRERYILTFLINIQNQNYKDIEIILVDDCSKDNTVKMIEEYQKIDQRIILLKNKKNKGTFLSRNIGIQYSKTKYIIIPDPDDIISKNILYACYKFSVKYHYEIIRFNMLFREGFIFKNKYSEELPKKQINQPELSYNIFYFKNELIMTDSNICNKFINKKTYIKSLNSLNIFYSNLHLTVMEDQMMNYILHKIAKTFYFLKIIGYYYNTNSNSITNNMFKLNKLMNYFIFIYIKLLFDYSKNTKYEKDMANYLFSKLFKNIKIEREASKKNLNFYDEIIKMYINNKFISNENKNIFKKFKKIIEKEINIPSNNNKYVIS